MGVRFATASGSLALNASTYVFTFGRPAPTIAMVIAICDGKLYGQRPPTHAGRMSRFGAPSVMRMFARVRQLKYGSPDVLPREPRVTSGLLFQ